MKNREKVRWSTRRAPPSCWHMRRPRRPRALLSSHPSLRLPLLLSWLVRESIAQPPTASDCVDSFNATLCDYIDRAHCGSRSSAPPVPGPLAFYTEWMVSGSLVGGWTPLFGQLHRLCPCSCCNPARGGNGSAEFRSVTACDFLARNSYCRDDVSEAVRDYYTFDRLAVLPFATFWSGSEVRSHCTRSCAQCSSSSSGSAPLLSSYDQEPGAFCSEAVPKVFASNNSSPSREEKLEACSLYSESCCQWSEREGCVALWPDLVGSTTDAFRQVRCGMRDPTSPWWMMLCLVSASAFPLAAAAAFRFVQWRVVRRRMRKVLARAEGSASVLARASDPATAQGDGLAAGDRGEAFDVSEVLNDPPSLL